MARRGGRRRRRRGSPEIIKTDLDVLIERVKEEGRTSLNLSGHKLTALPKSILTLTELRELFIEDNKLSHLPAWIGQFAQLEVLHAGNNRLANLPESLGDLTGLRNLDVSNNFLSHLPTTIEKLTKLEELDLSNNRFYLLPESIWQLSSLAELYLHGNDLLEIPTEILGPTHSDVRANNGKAINPRSIRGYYRESIHGAAPLNEAKLIFVGRGGVGKTSLINRLVESRFSRNEKKTEGIKITSWNVNLKGGEKAKLNIWDFGGQEIMHATHQFFLTERSLYILVLNGREGGEEADAEYWLKLIESFGGESPIIVVLNKIKEHPFDVNRRSLARKYVGVRRFLTTDCEDNTGIHFLRRAIKLQTDNLEHLRDPFPSQWFKIKQWLGEMKRNYLTFEQYRSCCSQLGEEDKEDQENLAVYLHCLGIALNYRDDARLRDTHVLNPHWVTKGIYTILNSPIVEFQNGEINLNQLAEILDQDEYPPVMQRFIMDLMKKFELCFSFPGDDSQYLIPELLRKQEPIEASFFSPNECLNFEYYYDVLPEGLLPRFIVRTHWLSENLPRWRTGVILEFESNKALVTADLQERRVYVRISGEIASRRRLLAVIRSDFDRIHADIKKLKPAQMVPLPTHPAIALPYEELIVMERDGVRRFPKVVEGQTVEQDVSDLLDGVDFRGTDAWRFDTGVPSKPIRIFYSYSHKDEQLRNLLETHLKILQRRGLVSAWHDRMIEAGDEWRSSIDSNLERADIILLLVSSDFTASDYCWEREMRRSLERHKSGDAHVVPIILRPVNWEGAPFAELQALPTNARPVTTWKNRDSAWTDISKGIEQLAKEMLKASYTGR
ncbi:MAG: COR domain-containing protein [Pyrinomonadaceae bacterium]